MSQIDQPRDESPPPPVTAEGSEAASVPAPLPQVAERTTRASRLSLATASFFLSGLAFALLAVLMVFWPGPLAEETTAVIPRGASVREIAALLEGQGVLSNTFVFRGIARAVAADNLHAGEYRFTPGMRALDVVLMLRDGRSITRRFTVVEGLTSHDIAALVRDDSALSGDLDAIPPDGEILPETYNFNYGDSRSGLMERMRKGQRDLLDGLWANRATNLPLKTPQEAVVMASLIEKETGKKPDERARVAGVFYNRLRLGMRLQSDPTVIYALTKGQGPLGRDLSHADLATPSPFNTYVNAGLPPQPICNPGRAALEAALHPEEHDFLYFVADGTGGHAFAKTLSQHNQNVARWLALP